MPLRRCRLFAFPPPLFFVISHCNSIANCAVCWPLPPPFLPSFDLSLSFSHLFICCFESKLLLSSFYYSLALPSFLLSCLIQPGRTLFDHPSVRPSNRLLNEFIGRRINWPVTTRDYCYYCEARFLTDVYLSFAFSLSLSLSPWHRHRYWNIY